MSVTSYNSTVAVGDGENVNFKATFKDSGSAAYHVCDLPGPHDKEGYNEDVIYLGTGSQLKSQRTVVFSKPTNINSAVDSINVEYTINGTVVASHSSKKSNDLSPLVKINIDFQ
jgi:hypothetical protein